MPRSSVVVPLITTADLPRHGEFKIDYVQDIVTCVIESFNVLNVHEDIQALIREALDSDKWDWFTDCDGCTAVSEVYWPTIYFPPCLRHDFDWFTGNGGWESNMRFYRIQLAYGMSPIRAGIRFAGVTVAWFAWCKWTH